MNWPALRVFVALFLFVTGLGFWAARWRAGDLTRLHDGASAAAASAPSSPGSCSAATCIPPTPSSRSLPWSTAPARWGSSPIPYTILIYPLLYLVFPRLWSLAHKHGYVTSSDVVLGATATNGWRWRWA